MYFAKSGNLDDLLNWFYSEPPRLFESSWNRRHPILMCFLVPGARESQSFIGDLIQHRESLNLTLGPDVAFFMFGSCKIDCIIPCYRIPDCQRANGKIDVSNGLGVWRSIDSAQRSNTGDPIFWTIDSMPMENFDHGIASIEQQTAKFAGSVIRKFEISSENLPSLVLLYADQSVSPWIISLGDDIDSRRLFSLIKNVRALSEGVTKRLIREFMISSEEVIKVLDYPNEVSSLEQKLDQAAAAQSVAELQLNDSLLSVVNRLSDLGLSRGAATAIEKYSKPHRIFSLCGYKKTFPFFQNCDIQHLF